MVKQSEIKENETYTTGGVTGFLICVARVLQEVDQPQQPTDQKSLQARVDSIFAQTVAKKPVRLFLTTTRSRETFAQLKAQLDQLLNEPSIRLLGLNFDSTEE